MGEDVKFVITNTDTGHYQVHRTRIVPFLPDTEPSNSLGGFPPGANVEGCMTNFANGHTSCYRNVVEPGGVDFYVSAVHKRAINGSSLVRSTTELATKGIDAEKYGDVLPPP